MPEPLQIDCRLPPKLKPLLDPMRYKVLYGGRGGAKSWSVARWLILCAASRYERILCAREFQNSIAESVIRLLADQIEAMGLSQKFEVQKNAIYGKRHGSEFIFAGIRSNPTKIKSTEGITKCWVEEAEKVSKTSWEIVIPTIRRPGSEIIVTLNLNQESDPTSQMFVINPPPDSLVIQLNWDDNPWFPDELRKEKDYLYRVDPDAAAHVWGGGFATVSAAQIFKGKCTVEAFEPQPHWDGPYQGADWGFSSDPSTLVRVWFDRPARRLLIEHEAYGHGVDLNDIPKLWSAVPDAWRYPVRADNSRPETISHVSQLWYDLAARKLVTEAQLEECKKAVEKDPRGRDYLRNTVVRYSVVGAEKWPGSVEDGIQWLRSLEQIVIHPRCKYAEQESRLYRYKTDKITGDVLRDVEDRHNHIWDAVRYALVNLICEPEMPVTVVHDEPLIISEELHEFESGLGGW